MIEQSEPVVIAFCSLAYCIRIKQMGYEPILRMVARDRNRIAIQADLLGGTAFGIDNIPCLTGYLHGYEKKSDPVPMGESRFSWEIPC